MRSILSMQENEYKDCSDCASRMISRFPLAAAMYAGFPGDVAQRGENCTSPPFCSKASENSHVLNNDIFKQLLLIVFLDCEIDG